MEILISVAVAVALGATLDYFGGVVHALGEIYLAAESPLPLILTVAAAIGLGWLGLAVWQASLTTGERYAAAILVGVGALLALTAGAVWRHAHNARTPDHEPRG